MLTLQLSIDPSATPDPEEPESYPDEVLNAEWNPVITEVLSLRSKAKSSLTVVPKLQDATAAVHLKST